MSGVASTLSFTHICLQDEPLCTVVVRRLALHDLIPSCAIAWHEGTHRDQASVNVLTLEAGVIPVVDVGGGDNTPCPCCTGDVRPHPNRGCDACDNLVRYGFDEGLAPPGAYLVDLDVLRVPDLKMEAYPFVGSNGLRLPMCAYNTFMFSAGSPHLPPICGFVAPHSAREHVLGCVQHDPLIPCHRESREEDLVVTLEDRLKGLSVRPL